MNMWDLDLLHIVESTKKINNYIAYRVKYSFKSKLFYEVLDEIVFVLEEWTGKTYVGEVKENEVETTFQSFYMALADLILTLEKDVPKLSIKEKCFIKGIKYSGTVYRYLGHCCSQDKSELILKYSDIYVSWTKNKIVHYLESKLYGKVLRLECRIPNDNFGIDVEGFQRFYNIHFPFHRCDIARQDEREVIFPTIKKYVVNIEVSAED